MKYISKPIERDPNAAPKSKSALKVWSREVREALENVTLRSYRTQTLSAPYSLRPRLRFVSDVNIANWGKRADK